MFLVASIFVLSLIVFVHEMGHFLVGRWCGVKVETFSLGFGRRLLSFYDRRGTQWTLSLIPLGGYVKFKGDADPSSRPDETALAGMSEADKKDSFPHQSLSKRAAIVAAGPLANFILAFFIFSAHLIFVGQKMVMPVIGEVVQGSAADAAGFQALDRILAVNGAKVKNFEELSRKIAFSDGQVLSFLVERNNETITLSATPNIFTNKTVLGTDRRFVMGFIAPQSAEYQFVQRYSLASASIAAVREIGFIVERTGSYAGGVVSGKESADQISGPLRIFYILGKVAQIGLDSLILVAAAFSVSVGLINLLPIPVLDGGHLMFYAIEGLFRRPVGAKVQAMGYRLGFMLVICLMLFSTWNDVSHLAGLFIETDVSP